MGNADRVNEIGKEILTGMAGETSDEYVLRKVNQAMVIRIHKHPKAVNEEVQGDRQLLFQRFITVRILAGQDGDFMFKYEQCTVPTSFFESNTNQSKANKPLLEMQYEGC